jgi:hypothetical protein
MRRLIVTAWLGLVFLWPNAAWSAENSYLLKTITTPDKAISVQWFGEKPDPANTRFPVQYYANRMVFNFGSGGGNYEVRPKGRLFHCCYHFDVFSPDWKYVVLLQDHYGPFHVVSAGALKRYLQGNAGPYRVTPGKAPKPAHVTHFKRWVSKETFEYVASCCGESRYYQYDITHGTRSLIKTVKHPAR